MNGKKAKLLRRMNREDTREKKSKIIEIQGKKVRVEQETTNWERVKKNAFKSLNSKERGLIS